MSKLYNIIFERNTFFITCETRKRSKTHIYIDIIFIIMRAECKNIIKESQVSTCQRISEIMSQKYGRYTLELCKSFK